VGNPNDRGNVIFTFLFGISITFYFHYFILVSMTAFGCASLLISLLMLNNFLRTVTTEPGIHLKKSTNNTIFDEDTELEHSPARE